MSRSKLRKSTCTQTCVSKKRPWHGWLRRTLSQGDIGLTMLYFHSSKLSDYAASTRRFDPFPQGNAGRRGIIRGAALCPLCRYRHKIHWTKHERRLDRDFGRQKFGDAGYAREELVAELGAAF